MSREMKLFCLVAAGTVVAAMVRPMVQKFLPV